MENEKAGNSFMLKICAFIVDKRNLFFLIYAILCIFSAVSRNWVSVENELAQYLPGTSETRQGLDLMEEQFKTYGSVKVMVANISYDQALQVKDQLEDMDGIFSAEVDDTSDGESGNGKIKSYDLVLPTDDMFVKVHGQMVLHYSVYTDKNIVLLTNITCDDNILEEGHRTELKAYKGVMISKDNPEKDMFKINLLNMLQK